MNSLEEQLKRVSVPVGDLVKLRPKFLRLNILAKIVVLVGLVIFIFMIIQKAKYTEADGSLIKKVAQLMILPDEKPVIIAVTDVAHLKKNSFFRDAKAGNKVLVFRKADRAVLYDPSLNKILSVGSLYEMGLFQK